MRRAGTQVLGNISIATHLFSEVGDTLPLHAHPVISHTHRTIVAKGSVRLLGSRDGEVLREGDIANFGVNEPHGFVAVIAPAIIYNVRLAFANEQDWPMRDIHGLEEDFTDGR